MFSLKHIILGQHLPGNKLIHLLDPRTKIICFVIISIGLLTIKNPVLLIFYTLFMLFFYMSSGISIIRVFKSLKPILWLLLITSFLTFIFTPGTALLDFKYLKVTQEGVIKSILLSGRLVLLISFSLLLTFTTSPVDLTDGLGRILKPLTYLGLPINEIVFMMSIALRFIPLLYEEADRIVKAQISRGADFSNNNLIAISKNLIPLFIPLLLGIFRRADELALAIEIRGYRLDGKRTRMKPLRMKYVDYFVLISFLIFTWVILLK